jgi:tRNA (cytosine38-C5)-methyltransferase
MQCLPIKFGEPFCLEEILETSVPDKFLVQDKYLKRGNILDICHRDSNRSCCFTKAYSHYIEGTGSVFTEADKETVVACYEKANNAEVGSEEFVETLKTLRLRFFTPKEILLLMCFPINYHFPDAITTKQCYRLLGNSVNVRVISEILKLLFN